uniref:Immunoglobulin I-set domain containing protein n=1 Tax=Haemonchus contortus TaxID=6289 RepID=A0A7I4Y662_HAECO
MYAPFFEAPPSLLRKPDGSVLFECICSGNPEPTIKWFFKDQELKNDRFVQKIKKSVGKWAVTLIMKNPTQDDQGVYKVVATNSAGSHSVEQQYVHSQTANEIFKTQ